MATTKRLGRERPSRFDHFTRRHSPFQPPRFSAWHALLAVGLTLTFAAQQQIPGLLGDLGGLVVGQWQAGVIVRVSVIALFAYAMLFVRGLHPLAYAGMIAGVLSLCLRLGEIRITHEPLTAAFALAQLAYTLFAFRAITRQPDPIYRREP